MTAQPARGAEHGSVVEQASAAVQEKAAEAKGVLGQTVRGQVDARSAQAGEQLTEVVTALRRTSDGLRSDGKAGPAAALEGITDRTDRVATYLSGSDAERILRDAEELGRKNPWVVIGGGILAGLVASRFLKASSNRRFEQLRGQYASSYRPPATLAGPQGTLPGGSDRAA